jgi:hypothetical protein
MYLELDWDDLYKKRLASPWIPDISDPLDVSNFDDIYDTEPEFVAEYDGTNEDFEGF